MEIQHLYFRNKSITQLVIIKDAYEFFFLEEVTAAPNVQSFVRSLVGDPLKGNESD